MTLSWTGMPAEPRDISPYDIAQEVLGRVVQQFLQAGIAIPGRQLVYLSPIPADCEQLAVLIGTVNISPVPQEGMFKCLTGRWAVNIGVVVSRNSCAYTNGKTGPKIEDMERAARIASGDAMVLMDLAAGFDEVGTIELTMSPPGGALQTVELNVQLPITGNF